jgi:hypothetical protein
VSAGAAFRAEGADRQATRRIGQLFLAGSILFAVGSLPGARDLTLPGSAAVLFAGSIFFTSAAAEQLRTSESDRLDIGSAAVQLAGTIMFNLNTFAALDKRLDTRSLDFLVWLPNAMGSVCFLICSAMACVAVRAAAPTTRRIASLNMLGSLAFGVSAVTAFIQPSTHEALNQAVSSWGTLIGALFFAAAAWLLIPRR